MAEIIFALDFSDLGQAKEWVSALKEEIGFFKVGFQLFTAYGPQAVEMVKKEGKKVFLDLKILDIPRTVANAVGSAVSLGCDSMTVHIIAGETALKEAKEKQKEGIPHLWGVTVLSSIVQGDSVERARLAHQCNLEGVIVSGQDVVRVKKEFPNLELVVPGIRPSSYQKADDQKRVLTPGEAVEKGANFLVIGRPIQQAKEPLKVVREIKEEIEGRR